jgi:D-3-phosphoglycerate dehydrogenase
MNVNGISPTVAVTDYTFESLDTERAILEPLGFTVVGRRCRTPPELIDLVEEADGVITQFAPVNAAVIEAMRRARVIVRYGIGVDNIDLDAARARGIPVCNVPTYCLDEVADHTLALLLALTRQVVSHCTHIRGGQWGGATRLTAMHALKELTVGIVGFGRIGREVAGRLRAFKCRVLAADPMVPPTEIERAGCTPVSLDELLRSADVVSLHCPSTAGTRRLIDRTALAKMKRSALLINVARGDVVDSEALVEALQDGRLGGAGLDVFDPEPIPPDHPLLGMSNVILTPHIASASVPAATALRTMVAQTVVKALRGEPLPNVVNGVNGIRV